MNFAKMALAQSVRDAVERTAAVRGSIAGAKRWVRGLILRSNIARMSSRGESLPTTEFHAELCLDSDARPPAYSLLKQIKRDETAIKPLIYRRFPFSTRDLEWRYFRGIFATSLGEMTSAPCKGSVSDCFLDTFARASSELAWMPTRQAPSEIFAWCWGQRHWRGK